MAVLIESVHAVPQARRLVRPLRTAAGELVLLPGVRVTVKTAEGTVGSCDAPFLNEKRYRMGVLAAEVVAEAAKWCGVPACDARAELPRSVDFPAEVRWAFDVACAEAEALAEGTPLIKCIARPSRVLRVRTNGLVASETPGEVEASVAACIAHGEHTLKLKVGALPLEVDVERATAARREAGPDVTLRFDANGAWDEEGALRAIEALAPLRPEYVEEPLAGTDLEGLARLRAKSPVPLYADESARDASMAMQIISERAADGLVLKPPTLGTLGEVEEVVSAAEAAGISVVFSSLFDTASSLWAQVGLAAKWAPDVAHGLATADWLEFPGAAPRSHRGEIAW